MYSDDNKGDYGVKRMRIKELDLNIIKPSSKIVVIEIAINCITSCYNRYIRRMPETNNRSFIFLGGGSYALQLHH